MSTAAARAHAAAQSISKVETFFMAHHAAVSQTPAVADFTFGNPHEMALPPLVQAIKTRAEPQDVNWYAYKSNESEACAFLAGVLSEELGLPYEEEDIALTKGAFGAIKMAFTMLLEAGDECIVPLPGWFCYGSMLAAAGAVEVQVPLASETFDLDLAAIAGAITPKTRIVVVNTPHNPTGRIYSRAELEALADLLNAKSREIGRRIWILSDEPYRRIRFDGIGFTSPAAVYPHTLIDYSYGKILLAPGLRLGYLAITPTLPAEERNELRALRFAVQMADGWNVPDAPLIYALPDLETLSIDLGALARRRDHMLGALSDWGYRMTRPEGTFYLWGRAPGDDSGAFAEALAQSGIYVMPGTIFDRPTDFRICLTATDDMITAALPAFQAAAQV
ncbi:aminotransferase class I/II-fold pyridoxal phosphate-dependent enzyme [Sedimentimonas flavescens]|uniref:aminotransferase class I/II-fold pyridoxal phosphate-dependent enzyme n=1 Tax=Sedimentimonas flavescens TaxID=2851012 RepID=UPI001C4A50AA|nr:aminotransferase class I/II-fold pyridoxal phosphate-dependent enzyme [Sedimentimonas flavescens]MBW0159431.1 aminotransferase class I/II-fold pyridoxal phosphate-dependent enzyme [Sedimentimonas flavescens]